MQSQAATDLGPSTGLARVYTWGRLAVGLTIITALILEPATGGALADTLIKAGLSALTLLPALGLLVLAWSWLRCRLTDPVGWLALVGSAFLAGAWLFG